MPDADSAYRAHINETLSGEGLAYTKDKDGFTNKNFLWLLVEDVGLETLKSKVKRPLEGLRVGPFYGCYVIRPKQRLGYDDHPDRDLYLERVIETLGGEVVEYDGARRCCGFPVITMNRETSLKQAGTHVGDAIDAGADCLVTPCPLCHLNLDMQQPEAAKVVGRDPARGPAPPPARRPGARLLAEGAGHAEAHRQHRRGRRPRRRDGLSAAASRAPQLQPKR